MPMTLARTLSHVFIVLHRCRSFPRETKTGFHLLDEQISLYSASLSETPVCTMNADMQALLCIVSKAVHTCLFALGTPRVSCVA